LALLSFAGIVQAQSVVLLCTRPGTTAAMLITINYTDSTVTYVARWVAGNDSPPIVSRANVSSTNVTWVQNEENVGAVNYNLNRVSGELGYSYYERGDFKSAQRACALAQPKF
jgi:hypothetical protein